MNKNKNHNCISLNCCQFRRRIPIGNSKNSKDETTGFGRKNDIKIGGMFDRDCNGHVYRHKNYRQIFLPLQVMLIFL